MSNELHPQAEQRNDVTLSGSGQPVTVEVMPRHLKMHNVSENEIDALASGGSSLNLTFFGICFGALISFGIVLFNGVTDPAKNATYSMLTFATGIMAAYFGIRAWIEVVRSKKRLRVLKQSLVAGAK